MIKDRFLFIYDCKYYPITIGDLILHYHMAKNLANLYDVKKIDFLFYISNYEEKHIDPSYKHLDNKSIYTEILKLSSIISTDAWFNNILFLDYIPDNYLYYYYKPNTYLYYDIYNNFILNNNHIQIEFNQYYKDKVNNIFKKEDTDIVLNLRKLNQETTKERDYIFDDWKIILEELKEYKILFSGNYKEQFPELSIFNNIIFIKEKYQTSLVEDVILSDMAKVYFGSCSGPAEIRRTKNKTTVLTQMTTRVTDLSNIKVFKDSKNTNEIINSIKEFLK